MNKSDLKKLIKPIVKECINEVLLEEGMLSNIVSEVAVGLQGNTITETRTAPQPQRDADVKRKNKEATKKIQQHRKKMMEAIGTDAYNGVDLFEGTTPMSSQESSQARAGSVDLGSPGDSGVDISSLVGGASQIWKAMK
tara:strand:- start:302 stop:718 length:417 start_codon:yes stop_codon:yes gene_type:complete